MRFLIKRTSTGIFSDIAPIIGAEPEELTRVIQSTPYTKPFEERVTQWWIDVPSLEALLELVTSEGRVIVDWEDLKREVPTIEIYDDYRE